MLLMDIPDLLFKQYDKIIKDILWEGKKLRIQISKMYTPRDMGELGLPVLDCII